MMDKCAEKANIEIYLGNTYRIDYAVVYPGKGGIIANAIIY